MDFFTNFSREFKSIRPITTVNHLLQDTITVWTWNNQPESEQAGNDLARLKKRSIINVITIINLNWSQDSLWLFFFFLFTFFGTLN